MTNHYRNFYRLAIVLLNILILWLFLIDAVRFITTSRPDNFKLMWDCVNFAITVFLDISQQNVLNQINHKPVASTVVVLANGLAVVTILSSFL